MIAFYAILRRLRFIDRWALMRKIFPENVQEHSFDVAVLAHALALIRREILNLEGPDPEHCATMALYHDASESLTGDLPTPVKYHNATIKNAYKDLESQAEERLLRLLPEELKPHYKNLFASDDAEARRIVKAADSLAAYIKAQEELAAGNREFQTAVESLERKLDERSCPELEYFLTHCFPAYAKSLDELEPQTGKINF